MVKKTRKYSVMILLLWLSIVCSTQTVKTWDPGFDIAVDGEYCQYGEFQGTPLYWRALWAPCVTDTPGNISDSGRSNPWVPVNSLAFTKGEEYQWVGWNSGCTKYKIRMNYERKSLDLDSIGTWGEQIDKKAPGAYIPTWRDGAEGAYTLIMDDVAAMSYEGDIEPAVDSLKKFPWCHIGFAVKVDAMSSEEAAKIREMVLQGHEIMSHSYDHLPATAFWQYFYHGDTIPTEDPSIPREIRGLVVDTTLSSGDELTAVCRNMTYKNADPMHPESVTSKVVYIVSDYVPDPNPDTEQNIWENRGRIKGEHWGIDVEMQKGVPLLKVECYGGWDESSLSVNVDFAKNYLDTTIYNHEDVKEEVSAGSAVREVSSFAFPYNLNSNEHLQYLNDHGYLSARGGSNWGEPLPGDFYDPFRLNYDNFFMIDIEAEHVWPDNPHMKLGIKEMPDLIIASKGYMIRQFHAVYDKDEWDPNCPVLKGWWGSMPTLFFQKHLLYLDSLRQEHKLFVAPPTEVVKYRMMTNAAVKAYLKNESNYVYSLDVQMDAVPEKYSDEISVIVTLEEPLERCVSQYENSSKTAPRYQPRKMDDEGYSWSISFNPFEGRILFGRLVGPHVLQYKKDSMKEIRLLGVNDSKFLLQLPKGHFSFDILTPAGKVIREKSVVSYGGMSTMVVPTLAHGVYILRVKNQRNTLYLQKILIQ